jgi:hypothetical protein
MREPKLIYSGPVEDLVGRKVINQSGYIGTIVPNRLLNTIGFSSLPIEVKFEAITLWYRGDGYYRLRNDEGWIKFVDETEEDEMTTNQLQAEEQRIADIKRKAEKAHTLYRHYEGVYYKVDAITANLVHVSYTGVNNLDHHFQFAFEDIDAEDKFFELTEIK